MNNQIGNVQLGLNFNQTIKNKLRIGVDSAIESKPADTGKPDMTVFNEFNLLQIQTIDITAEKTMESLSDIKLF